jgi:hypothetical protein
LIKIQFAYVDLRMQGSEEVKIPLSKKTKYQMFEEAVAGTEEVEIKIRIKIKLQSPFLVTVPFEN